MSIIFFDLPYGADNPVDRPYISKRYDSDQTSFLSEMQKLTADSYEADVFEGTKRRFKAYVLRIDTKQQEHGKSGTYVSVRAWCPETHPSLRAFKPQSYEDHQNIDKFPLYRAVQTSTPAPNPGEEVWVKYLNFENLQGARYLEPVNEREHLVNLIQSTTPAGAFASHPCAALSTNAIPAGDTSGARKTFPGGDVKLNKVVIIGTSMVGQDADGRGMMGKALNNLLQEMGAGQVVQIGVAGSVLRQWITGDFASKKTKANSSGLSIASVAQERPNVFFVALGGNDRATSVSQFLDYARQVMNTLSPDKSIPIVWMGHTHTNQRAQPEKIRERYRALATTLPSEYPNLLMIYPDNQSLIDIYIKAGGKWHPSETVHKQFFKAVISRITSFLGIQEKQQKPEQTDPITPKSPAQTPTGAPVSPPAAAAGCNTVSTVGAVMPGSQPIGPPDDLGAAAKSLEAVKNPETHWNFPATSAPPGDWNIKYFTPQDLQSRGNGMVVMNKKALRALDKAAGRAGQFGHPPIRLTNQVSAQRNGAYRDPELNRKEGGAKGSRHQYGDGFDIWTKDHTKEQRLALLRNLYNVGFRGFGHGRNNIHADTSNKRMWSYNKYPKPKWSEFVA